jgi:ammonia channel protein AmtB
VDWTSTNHLLQALLVVAAVFITWMGFNAGNRLD